MPTWDEALAELDSPLVQPKAPSSGGWDEALAELSDAPPAAPAWRSNGLAPNDLKITSDVGIPNTEESSRLYNIVTGDSKESGGPISGIAEGAVSGLKQIPSMLGRAVLGATDLMYGQMGAKDEGEEGDFEPQPGPVSQVTRALAEPLIDSSRQETERLQNKYGRWATAPAMVTSTLPFAFAGPAAPYIFGSQMYEDAIVEANKAGLPEQDAHTYALGQGALGAFLSKIVGRIGNAAPAATWKAAASEFAKDSGRTLVEFSLFSAIDQANKSVSGVDEEPITAEKIWEIAKDTLANTVAMKVGGAAMSAGTRALSRSQAAEQLGVSRDQLPPEARKSEGRVESSEEFMRRVQDEVASSPNQNVRRGQVDAGMSSTAQGEFVYERPSQVPMEPNGVQQGLEGSKVGSLSEYSKPKELDQQINFIKGLGRVPTKNEIADQFGLTRQDAGALIKLALGDDVFTRSRPEPAAVPDQPKVIEPTVIKPEPIPEQGITEAKPSESSKVGTIIGPDGLARTPEAHAAEFGAPASESQKATDAAPAPEAKVGVKSRPKAERIKVEYEPSQREELPDTVMVKVGGGMKPKQGTITHRYPDGRVAVQYEGRGKSTGQTRNGKPVIERQMVTEIMDPSTQRKKLDVTWQEKERRRKTSEEEALSKYSPEERTEIRRRSADANNLAKAVASDEAQMSGVTYQGSQAMREHKARTVETVAADSMLESRAHGLPKTLERVLNQDPTLANMPLRSVEIVPHAVEEPQNKRALAEGDKFKLAGDKYEVKELLPDGRVRVKDGLDLKFPATAIPIDKGSKVVKAKQSKVNLSEEFAPGLENTQKVGLKQKPSAYSTEGVTEEAKVNEPSKPFGKAGVKGQGSREAGLPSEGTAGRAPSLDARGGGEDQGIRQGEGKGVGAEAEGHGGEGKGNRVELDAWMEDNHGDVVGRAYKLLRQYEQQGVDVEGEVSEAILKVLKKANNEYVRLDGNEVARLIAKAAKNNIISAQRHAQVERGGEARVRRETGGAYESAEDAAIRREETQAKLSEGQGRAGVEAIMKEKGVSRAEAERMVLEQASEPQRTSAPDSFGLFGWSGKFEGAKAIASKIREYFFSRGNLPEDVFQAKIRKEADVNAESERVGQSVSDLQRAIKKTMPNATAKDFEAMDSYVKGGAPGNLSPEVRSALDSMRTHVDELSQKLIDDGILTNGLEVTVDKNKGVYMNRSYQVFDNPDYANKVKREAPGLVDAAKVELKKLDPTATDAEIEGALNNLLLNGTAAESPDSMLRGSKLGSKDLTSLMKRKDVPEWIRNLWGEYKDPIVNYQRTILKQANLIANHAFQKEIRNAGLGKFFFEKPTGEHAVEIGGENSKALKPLIGDKPLYTTPEIKSAFEEGMTASQNGAIVNSLIYLNGAVKMAKTVLGGPTSTLRNFTSNTGFAVANGLARPAAMKQTLDHLVTLVSDKAKWNSNMVRYTRLGVIGDSVGAAEVREAINAYRQRWGDARAHLDKGLAGKAFDVAKESYMFGDDVWKIFAFENNVRDYSEAYKGKWTQEQVERKAAEITRNQFPTYSMLPKAVRGLRRTPVLGTFVAFPWEVYRTAYNTLDLTRQELAKPETRAIGVRRLLGITTAAALPAAVAAASKAASGVTGDKEEAARKLLAPWSKNNEIVWLSTEPGKLRYIDLGYQDPYTNMRAAVIAFLRGKSPGESAMEAAKEIAQPFVDWNMTTKSLVNVAYNRQDTGKPIYNQEADATAQAKDIAGYLWQQFQPGFMATGTRIYEGVNGQRDLNDELTALSGVRVNTLDVKKSILYRGIEYRDRASKALLIYTGAKSKGITGSALEEARMAADKASEDVYEWGKSMVEAADDLGVSKIEVRRILKDAGVSDPQARMVTGDRYVSPVDRADRRPNRKIGSK